MGATSDTCEWAAALDYEGIPERTRRAAKLQVMSVLAATWWGQRSWLLQRVRRGVLGPTSPIRDGVSLVGNEATASLMDAIFVDTSASVVHDFDDYLFAGHTGHSAVLVSLKLSEYLSKLGSPVDGSRFLTAVVAANEAGGRLGASMLFGPHNGQMWSYVHLIGASVAASKLLGLDAEATESAVGLAFSQPNYPLLATFMGSEGKAFVAAQPSVDGTRAALLAAEGVRGARGILEDRNGFWAKFHKDALRHMFSGFGSAWVTDSLSYKVYPGCAYLDTAQDALFEISRQFESDHERAIRPEDVKSVRVEAGMLTAGMETMSAWYRTDRLEPINMNFSVALTGALSIVAGRLTPDLFEPSYLDTVQRDVQDLARRFEIVHSPAMTTAMAPRDGALDLRAILSKESDGLKGVDFSRYESRFPAAVELESTAGRTYRSRVDIPVGGAGRPFDETADAVERKLLAAFGSDTGSAIAFTVHRLEELPDVAVLARHCASRPGEG